MSENTNNLRLPYIMAAQAQKHVTHNEALRLLDDVVQISVASRSLNEPPEDVSEGQSFIVATNSTGAWLNRENQIAGWQDGAWQFHEPRDGWVAWDQSSQGLVVFSSGSWQSIQTETESAALFGINANADLNNKLTVKSDAVLMSHNGDNDGSGDMRLTVNKEQSSNTASLVFQSGWSGRAEVGLAGSDAFSVKVSPDGVVWAEAITVDPTTGEVTFPHTSSINSVLPQGGQSGQILVKNSSAADDASWADPFTTSPVDAGTTHLYERELGTLPSRPMVAQYNNGLVEQASNRLWTAAPGGDCWFIARLNDDQLLADDIYVEFRIDTGSFVDAYVDQMNGGSVVAGSRVYLTRERDRYILRNMVMLNGTDALRIRLRNVGNDSEVVFVTPGIGRGEPATLMRDATLVSLDHLLVDDANAAVDVFSISNTTTVIGDPPTENGGSITLAYGSLVNLTVPMEGLFTGSDNFLLLFQTSKPMKSVKFIPHSGQAGGGGSEGIVEELGNGWFAVSGSASGSGGEDPAYATLVLDNRSLTGLPDGEVTVSRFWLAKNTVGIPSQLSLPGVVTNAMSEAGVTTLYIDPNGNNANSGSRSAPIKTIEEAMERGAAKIFLRRNGIHRSDTLTVSRPIEISSYSQPGDDQPRAVVRFSQRVMVSDLTVTSQDSVFYFPIEDDPKGVWQVGNGELVRLGVVGPNGKNYPAADEANVALNPGSWWFGAGSQGMGLYVQPEVGYVPETTIEVPISNNGLIIGNAGKVKLTQVELGCAAETVLKAHGSVVEAEDCRFSHSGANDAVVLGGGDFLWWRDSNCVFADAGDDGLGTNRSVNARSHGSVFENCLGDGYAPHGDNNYCLLDSCVLQNNGKQGFVSIGQGEFQLLNCVAENNFDISVFVLLGNPTKSSVINMTGCRSQSTQLNCSDPTKLSANVYDHRGALHCSCNAKVVGLRAAGQGDLLRVSGGSVSVEQAHLSQGERGIRLDDGSLSVASTNIVGNQTGIAVLGGSVTLDSGGTVNVFNNAAQFDNVPPDQSAQAVAYPVV